MRDRIGSGSGGGGWWRAGVCVEGFSPAFQKPFRSPSEATQRSFRSPLRPPVDTAVAEVRQRSQTVVAIIRHSPLFPHLMLASLSEAVPSMPTPTSFIA